MEGNGQTELIEVITGLRKIQSGKIRLHGERIDQKKPRQIVERKVSVPRNIVASMLISGFLAGMGGAMMGLGYFQNMTIGGFQGYGYNGIAVALIGGNTAVGLLLAAFVFGGLQFGSGNMQFEADVAPEIIQAVIAFIVLLIASKGVFDFLMRKTETRGSGR